MDLIKKVKSFGKKIAKTVDKLKKEYEVSEKIDALKDKAGDVIDDVKEKAEKIDKEYKISDKLEDVKEKVVDTAENIKEKVEAKLDDKISFDDFVKVELKLGKILEAEEVKKSKKLYKLKVDFGEEKPRQILSGIKEYYDADKLVGKKVLFATNLAPRKIMGMESNGMILGLQGEKEFSLLVADRKRVEEGVKAG